MLLVKIQLCGQRIGDPNILFLGATRVAGDGAHDRCTYRVEEFVNEGKYPFGVLGYTHKTVGDLKHDYDDGAATLASKMLKLYLREAKK